jgi:hypothetical protein
VCICICPYFTALPDIVMMTQQVSGFVLFCHQVDTKGICFLFNAGAIRTLNNALSMAGQPNALRAGIPESRLWWVSTNFESYISCPTCIYSGTHIYTIFRNFWITLRKRGQVLSTLVALSFSTYNFVLIYITIVKYSISMMICCGFVASNEKVTGRDD